jgi:hypothetical protein
MRLRDIDKSIEQVIREALAPTGGRMCLPEDDSSTPQGVQVIPYEEMTPSQQRIVNAVNEATVRVPTGLSVEQMEEWLKANGM